MFVIKEGAKAPSHSLKRPFFILSSPSARVSSPAGGAPFLISSLHRQNRIQFSCHIDVKSLIVWKRGIVKPEILPWSTLTG
jgi:hypothetical protein